MKRRSPVFGGGQDVSTADRDAQQVPTSIVAAACGRAYQFDVPESLMPNPVSRSVTNSSTVSSKGLSRPLDHSLIDSALFDLPAPEQPSQAQRFQLGQQPQQKQDHHEQEPSEAVSAMPPATNANATPVPWLTNMGTSGRVGAPGGGGCICEDGQHEEAIVYGGRLQQA